jgi:hypothetical protein
VAQYRLFPYTFVFSLENGCPLAQCVTVDQYGTLGPDVDKRPLREASSILSLTVPINKWLGFTQAGLSHLWQAQGPEEDSLFPSPSIHLDAFTLTFLVEQKNDA